MNSSFIEEARALTSGESNVVANLANLSAHIYHSVSGLNWCGFYLLDSERNELVLGPFQGKVACLRIPYGKGVCGSAWKSGSVQNVPDVHLIANHIACDSASRSELVIPLYRNGAFVGVLDLDAPEAGRFDPGLEKILTALASEVISPLL